MAMVMNGDGCQIADWRYHGSSNREYCLVKEKIRNKEIEKHTDKHLGYNTGKGKTVVLSMWVMWLQVRCDILSPVATPYPLSWYHRLKQVFLLYNYK